MGLLAYAVLVPVALVAALLARAAAKPNHFRLERSTRIDAATLAHRAAQATRSDSLDILHTRITLDLTQVGTGQIFGVADLRDFATPEDAGGDPFVTRTAGAANSVSNPTPRPNLPKCPAPPSSTRKPSSSR